MPTQLSNFYLDFSIQILWKHLAFNMLYAATISQVKVAVLMEVVLQQIRPDEPPNIPSLFAVEASHAPQRVCAKDEAPLNILIILVTLDTSHFDRSPLKDDAEQNMKRMSVTFETSHFERSPLNDDAE